MSRCIPFCGACLFLALCNGNGFGGPIYSSVPRDPSLMAEAPVSQDVQAGAAVQPADLKSDAQTDRPIQSASVTHSATHIPGVKRTRSALDNYFAPGRYGEIRDTGFIPSFGYGPDASIRSLARGSSDSSGQGGGSGGGGGGGGGSGGFANFGQPASTFTQVASIPLNSGQTGGSTPSSGGSGSSSDGSGGSTGHSGSNGGSQGQGGGPTSGANTPPTDNPPGTVPSNPPNPGGSPGPGNDPDPIGSTTGPGPNPPGSPLPIVPAVPPVPEPPAIALCLIGFTGILCYAAYRRRGRR